LSANRVQAEARFDSEFLQLLSGAVARIVKVNFGTLNLCRFRRPSQPVQTNCRGVPSRVIEPIAGATLDI